MGMLEHLFMRSVAGSIAQQRSLNMKTCLKVRFPSGLERVYKSVKLQ